MVHRRFALHTAAVVLASLSLSVSAWADVTGTVWTVQGNWNNAGPNSIIGTNAVEDGTFTAANIDFATSSGTSTLQDFLNSGGATENGGFLSTALGKLMSNCSTSGPTNSSGCYSTVIEITGYGTFLGGTTYTLSHDDGAILCVADPTCSTPVINSPAPTNDIGTPWTPSSDTTGNFAIWYMGTNGNPEDLQISPNFATPEAGAISMLVSMLVGIAGFVGVFRKKLSA
jgi:hypothetical protein